jgi:hypothetical protein
MTAHIIFWQQKILPLFLQNKNLVLHMPRSTSSSTKKNIAIEESAANLVANTRAALDIFAVKKLSYFERAKLWMTSNEEGYYKNLRDMFFAKNSFAIGARLLELKTEKLSDDQLNKLVLDVASARQEMEKLVLEDTTNRNKTEAALINQGLELIDQAQGEQAEAKKSNSKFQQLATSLAYVIANLGKNSSANIASNGLSTNMNAGLLPTNQAVIPVIDTTGSNPFRLAPVSSLPIAHESLQAACSPTSANVTSFREPAYLGATSIFSIPLNKPVGPACTIPNTCTTALGASVTAKDNYVTVSYTPTGASGFTRYCTLSLGDAILPLAFNVLTSTPRSQLQL